MLGLRDLNRTLLARQHLLERAAVPALDMVEHLVGLQAQDNLPPYLSLAARIGTSTRTSCRPRSSPGAAVRLLSMRGTIHVLVPDDALTLRRWVQPALDQASGRTSRTSRRAAFRWRRRRRDQTLLGAGPLPVKELGERLAEVFPGVPGSALAHVARERVPLVQVPPRGLWQRRAAWATGPWRATSAGRAGRPTCPGWCGATSARSGPRRPPT